MANNEVWVILKRPAGPESDFVETEDENGQGVGGFNWEPHGDLWALGPFARASVHGELDTAQTKLKELKEALPRWAVLEQVASLLEARAIGPPSNVEHLRAKAAAIRDLAEPGA